jgi:hypothetical protein
MLLNDWLLAEVELLFIGLTKTSMKSGFDHPPVLESPLRFRGPEEAIGQIMEELITKKPMLVFILAHTKPLQS